MKKILLLFTILLLSLQGFSQAPPEAFTYQAVVRDNLGNIVANQAVSIQISILVTDIAGSPVYVEIHSLTTNAFGLIELEVGNGTPQSGTFSSIDWGADKHFLKTEIDPSGGSNYSITGTSQLLSVPYALHSKTAGSVLKENQQLSINGDTIFISDGNYIVLPGLTKINQLLSVQARLNSGETPCEIVQSGIPIDSLYGKTYQGGLIFYLNTSTCQGLVAAPEDQGTAPWGCRGLKLNGFDFTPNGSGIGGRLGDGLPNTNAIIAQCNEPNIAARLARAYDDGVSWFLPSYTEFELMIQNLVKKSFGNFSASMYWTSTEWDDINAYWGVIDPPTSSVRGEIGKETVVLVRAIKAF